jgi:hypothetical protein
MPLQGCACVVRPADSSPHLQSCTQHSTTCTPSLAYPHLPLPPQSPAELVLREDTPFNYCVIDEVDSILIDEARTPLIISGTSDKPSDKYIKVKGRAAG